MKEMKRFLSLILCLAMLVSVVPVSAFATETGDTQPTAATEPAALNEGDSNGTTTETTEATKATEATEATDATSATETTEATQSTEPEETTPVMSPPIIFGSVSEEAEVFDIQNLRVDDGVLQILAVSDYAGTMADVLAQVQTVYTDIDRLMFLGDCTDQTALLTEVEGYYTLDSDAVLVQGDQDALSDAAWSGNHDTDDYGTFIIHEDEYAQGSGEILSVLESYLTEKVNAGFDKPVFVLSHRGLHYGSGNEDARALFEILNKAGEEDLTVVYVYGQTDDDYVGKTAVYLPVGDQINIAESETYTEETLAFTYLNAGAASENATVITFNGETLSVSRYDAAGVCLLKDAGVADELMAADLETYESPAVIEITVPAAAVEETVPETTEPVVEEPAVQEPVVTDPYAEQRALYYQMSAELAASHQLAMEKAAAAAETPAETPVDAESDVVLEVTSEEAYNAGGETIYILAGGDFQEAGDHANSAANVTNILAQVSQKYTAMDGFLFIGDYDCETHDNATETANGITALMGAVQGKYSNLNDANSVLVQGNHDYKDSRIDATGGHEFDGYAVYVLNEDDYPNGGGSQAGIQALANNLKTWLNNKIGEGYDAPIFITSHLPLAYTPRTVTQGDAKYAKYIFDVLNDAAKNGLNIIFMHGHDHAYGPDNYMGGEAIYLPVGDKICIAEAGSTSAWTEETLNFTYMNAGYTGYYSDAYTYVTTAGTDKLTMTVFAITDSGVTVERYSEDGLYNLKSAGYDGSYSDTKVTNVSLGLPKYENVYTSPKTIALTAAEEYGSIGSWVGVSAEVTDDVTTSNNGWVELIAPVPDVPAVPGTPESTKYVYTLDTDGTVTDKANAEQGYLIVGSSNDYAMTDSLGRTGVTITDNAITLAAQPDYEWWITADGKITDGTNYLKFTGSYSFGGSPSGSVSVVTDESQATAWDISHDGNGKYTISCDYTYGSMYQRTTTFYLRYNSNAFSVNSSSNTVRLFSGVEVTTPATEGTPAVPGTNGIYAKAVGNLTYNAAVGQNADEALAALQAQVKVSYKEAMSRPDDSETGVEVLTDAPPVVWTWVDTYDGAKPGDYEVEITCGGKTLGTAEVVVPAATTYYIAEGNGLYLVDMNTTVANAMAAVKAGVTVYSATDASGSNKTAISDSEVTWNWGDTYNGADSGPYTVEILYDGTSLGTVEVKVNIQYETGINSDWTYIGETEATGGNYTYTLDTDGIDAGSNNKYIIVAESQALALHTSGSSAATAVSVNISSDGKTLTTSTLDYEYYWDNTYGFTRAGYNGLYQSSWEIYLGTKSASYLDGVVNHNNGTYTLYDNEGNERGLYYNGSSWTVNSSGTTTNYKVRLYKYTGTTGGTSGGSIYALIEGNTVYTVPQGTSATKALAAVKAGITGYTATDANGTGKTEIADSDLTWTWKNTFNGNSTGSYWVEIKYQGEVLGTVEVRVEPGTINNYPEYPDEGSVKVSKTGTGIDFQSSGIAQVEVSASGVPIKKGADVIVMLDTSSSMTSHTVTGTSKTRAQVLEESLKNLIEQFKTPGDDGQLLDLRVAIADFNGFYGENHNASGTPYDRDAADMMSDDISYNANSEAQVYTGDGTLGAGAFISVEDLAASYTLNYTSGTNYDYAFDAIYQMGTAIKEANTEDRDLYVIFMSDGAAMQWNYYHSQGASSLWNNWITGAWTANQLSLNCNTHAYYYDEVDHNGDGMRNEHRMANAIKGDPSEQYEVIRKVNTLGTPTGETNMYMVPGLGATMFSISFDAKADTNVTEESMDKSIESLASPQTGTTQYYYKVTTADELSSAFDAIGSEIAYAAYNARFVDQMGDDYNLQMSVSNYSVVDGTTTTDKTITPKIEIIQYDIYTKAEADEVPEGTAGDTVTNSMIGDRKDTYKILETVTFSDDGKKAYSDQIGGGTTNILADGTQTGYVKGVIYAKTFLYNTNLTAVAVEGVSIPTGTKADGTTTGSTNLLPAETFYWKMGTVQTSELAMRYYVYLTGSMEGTREGGSYPTNEYATLYYDNYLNNPCKKDTVSPVLAWKEANVSYAFYLVDKDGNIIVNQTTGATGSFANKIAVTNPVVYDTILLNNLDTVRSIEVASATGGILPVGYELYDTSSVYTVTINSNTTGSWEINKGADKVASTYVTQYDPDNASAYSNALVDGKNENGDYVVTGNDYTHTIVWFAVLWEVQALPDTVVVDYGLPVDISVLTNDMFGDNGKLAGVGAYSDSLNLDGHDTTLASGFVTNYTGTYGTAKADASTGKVRYTLKDMQMNGYEKFAYAVNYTGNENTGYYYDTVTVIPATTIYYEDSFVDLKSYTWSAETNGWVEKGSSLWTKAGTEIAGMQSEDRPGFYSITDANNIYGFDSVNDNMSMYSMGSAMKATVDYDNLAEATFDFYGTGFDVISMTDVTTGAITVRAYKIDADGNVADTPVQSFAVNTYYGCKQEAGDADGDGTVEDGEVIWVVDPESKDALWQVPVMKMSGLEYGKYHVKIRAVWDKAYEMIEGSRSYDFYLDAIRIYDPANDGASDGTVDTTIENAYKADGEGWPSYIELRNKIIAANSFDKVANDVLTTDMEGLVFIDGDASVGNAQMADYISYGPNNEIYLKPGQRIAFVLNTNVTNSAGENIVENIHIGLKSADGKPATCVFTNIAQKNFDGDKVKVGDYYNISTHRTINTSTEMYYDLTGWKGDIIVISNYKENTGTTGILSLTNIKATYKENPNAAAVAGTDGGLNNTSENAVNANQTVRMYMTPAAANLTVNALNAAAEEKIPDETVPETTVPETTVPETTVPEDTTPETTKPDETEPETTVREETEPETDEVVNTIATTVKKFVDRFKSFLSKWFR